MKKLITTVLALTMTAALTACGTKAPTENTQAAPAQETTAAEQAAEKAETEAKETTEAAKAAGDVKMVDSSKWKWPAKEELYVGFSQAYPNAFFLQ